MIGWFREKRKYGGLGMTYETIEVRKLAGTIGRRDRPGSISSAV